jgi:hypothetical protein
MNLNIRKTIIAGLAVSVVFAGGVSASGGPGLGLLVNGAERNYAVPPIIEQGRALVPLRQFCEEIGARVEFDAATGLITVIRDGTTLEVKPGLDIARPAFRDFSPQEAAQNSLNSLSRIIKGRTYVPVRYLAEMLGARVGWDDARQQVKVDLEVGTTVAFEWYAMTEAGPAYQREARTAAGNWHEPNYLQYMDFAVVLSEKDYLSQPPLQTFAPISPPAADYTRYIGLWSYLGEARTGGYGILAEQITVDGSNITVKVRLVSPEPGSMVTMAIDYPTDYVIVDRSLLGGGEKTFTFVDQTGKVLKTIPVTL